MCRIANPGGLHPVLGCSDTQLRHNSDKTPKISKKLKVVGLVQKLQGYFGIITEDDSSNFEVKIFITEVTRGHTLKSRGVFPIVGSSRL